MKLFYSPNACSRAVHIALVDAGAEFEPVQVDLPGGEQRTPEYRAINPKGRVPVLVTDRGPLTEVLAILAYVGQAYPEARLAPLDDAFAMGELHALNSFLASSVHVTFAHYFRGPRYAEGPAAHEAMKAKVPPTLHEHFTVLEDRMRGPWALGEIYSVADPYLFLMGAWLSRAETFPALSRYPKLADHAKRMRERPAVQKVIAFEDARIRG